MTYRPKKRPQDQSQPLPAIPEQNRLFAPANLDAADTDADISNGGNDSDTTLEARRQQANSNSFDFARTPLFAEGNPMQQHPRSGLVQAQLTVGAAGDQYEQEADRVAAQVVNTINRPQANEPMQREMGAQLDEQDTVQRSAPEESEDLQMKPTLQKVGHSGGVLPTGLESDIQSAKGSGQALDPRLQQSMGQAMGADFSDVNIHTDARADQLNQSIQAKAFTTGKDVFFRQGAYNPSSKGGQELIAHELTHVVQQTGNTVQRSSQSDRSRTPAVNRVDKIQPSYSSASSQVIQREIEIGQAEFDAQAIKLAKLYAVATAEQPSFAEKAANLKDATGATKLAIRGQDKIRIADKIKSMERAAFKGAVKYEGDIRQITDVVGASLVYRNLDALKTACDSIADALTHENLTLVRFKNRFKDPSPEEYADLMLNLQMTSGHIVELQMHLHGMKQQKDKEGAVNEREAKQRIRDWSGPRRISDDVLADWVRHVGASHNGAISGHAIYKAKRADEEYAKLVLKPTLEIVKQRAEKALRAITLQDRAQHAESRHVENVSGQQQAPNAAIQNYEAEKQKYRAQKAQVEGLLANARDLTELARVILYGPELQRLKQDREAWEAITDISLPVRRGVEENQTIETTYDGLFSQAGPNTYQHFLPKASEELGKHYTIVDNNPDSDEG